MSKSGKLKKSAKAQAMREQQKNQKPKTPSVKIFILLAVVITVLVSAVILWDKLHRTVALEIGNENVYTDEIMYYVYQEEAGYAYIDSLYQQMYGQSYWSTADESGDSNSEISLYGIRAQAAQDAILYQEAKEAGVSLTTEEQAAADEEAQTVFDAISESEKSSHGMTLERMKKLCSKIELGKKYKQQLIDSYDIDDAALEAEVDKDEYRQYDIQYYSVSYKTKDEDGNSVAVSESEQTALVEKLDALRQRTENGEDFEALIDEEEESEISFSGSEPEGVYKANTEFSDTVTNVIYAMANEELSDIIKDEESGCYYLIKMLDNNSTEAYEKQVKAKIESAESVQFTKDYEENMYPEYAPKYREQAWEQIYVGSTFTIAE